MEEKFDIMVIGNGLIGSAATRYLGKELQKVSLLGAPEPKYWSVHDGVFASHYDEGRITRIMDQNYIWSELACRSIADYAEIENSSGIDFFYPVGCLQGGPKDGIPDNGWNTLNHMSKEYNLKVQVFEGKETSNHYPYFSVEDTQALLETETAGYINPRALIRAQNKLASERGVKLIADIASKLFKKNDEWVVETYRGKTYISQKILLAAGAFTNGLLKEPLQMSIYPRTVLFACVSKDLKKQLENMPCIIWDLEPGYTFHDMYVLPPIPYHDGKDYIKIGGDSYNSETIHEQKKLKEWFKNGGSASQAEDLKTILIDLFPDIKDSQFHYKPCVTTHTLSGYPLIDELFSKGLYIACAGCGLAAKSSNELGRLAALRIMDKPGNSESKEGPTINMDLFSLPENSKSQYIH